MSSGLFVEIPDIWEVRYYSQASWNSKRLQRKPEAGDDVIGESPISLRFTLDGFVPKFWTEKVRERTLLGFKRLFGFVDQEVVEATANSQFDIPMYNPERESVELTERSRKALFDIIGGRSPDDDIEGEIVYTSMGPEIFVRDCAGNPQPLYLLS